ncbi:unnamed protein product [Ilex paraguariensis]|uniref:RNase H type-1 domain-containing protein n=1 Tax=Ilex paraguariensis TaxID=185542 RepID=A0ABC8QRQ7_9AQUA
MVLDKAVVPWRLQGFMEQIWRLLGGLNFQLRHVYREANMIADFLASLAVQTQVCTEFSSQSSLPLSGRMLIHQDQSGMPTARKRNMVICDQGKELDDVGGILLDFRLGSFPDR